MRLHPAGTTGVEAERSRDMEKETILPLVDHIFHTLPPSSLAQSTTR